MDTHVRPDGDSDSSDQTASEVHNASVDEAVAGQGACAQVHLPTGAMCVMQHGHEGSCEFSPAGDAGTDLATRKAAEHW